MGKQVVVAGDEQIQRVRKMCLALPGAWEKLSHGEPTFFAGKRVFAMFSNNHHNDGHVAVLIPCAPGMQATLIKTDPKKFYYPPYVGKAGWVGIELDRIDDGELASLLLDAYRLIRAKARQKR